MPNVQEKGLRNFERRTSAKGSSPHSGQPFETEKFFPEGCRIVLIREKNILYDIHTSWWNFCSVPVYPTSFRTNLRTANETGTRPFLPFVLFYLVKGLKFDGQSSDEEMKRNSHTMDFKIPFFLRVYTNLKNNVTVSPGNTHPALSFTGGDTAQKHEILTEFFRVH